MLLLPAGVRVYLCTVVTDMRRSFDGLAAMVEEHVGHDPLSGDLFVFCNRRGDRMKILLWDGDGYALWYKRLEEGTFCFPAGKSEVSHAELSLILEGIVVEKCRRRPRYVRPVSESV